MLLLSSMIGHSLPPTMTVGLPSKNLPVSVSAVPPSVPTDTGVTATTAGVFVRSPVIVSPVVGPIASRDAAAAESHPNTSNS